MSQNEKFVKSVYPKARIQMSGFDGVPNRIVTEPTLQGRWLGKKFDVSDRNKWKSAAEAVRSEMLRKLES
jgi:hypothetical protein